MADKVRIYQLAKDLELGTKEMLAVLDSMGVDYKSHSSTVDGDTAEAIRQLLEAERAEQEGGAEEGEPKAKETAGEDTSPTAVASASTSKMPHRAPVVTVMGHVDHGKTSLLDHIRKTRVADREAGGITQHIGAYQAETPNGPITFLDTPGHEAFTSIRQRGANATDIAVIVIAADDSIMPQTREAIAHAKAAQVPVIVAINKIDLPQADPDRVKQGLTQLGLVPEEYGGETITVEISAKTGQGIADLLEMISLLAEIEDLRASPEGPAVGVIIESILDKQAGVLATILVQKGTLQVADFLHSGETWGKVRRLTDHAGNQLRSAGPSVPVQVLGFTGQPVAGDTVVVVESEHTAKAMARERKLTRQATEREAIGRKNITLADLFGKTSAKTINLILRADTQGSLEAIKGVLARESARTDEVELQIMLAEVGAPTESDLLLASTAEATVIGFGVTPAGSVRKSAERQGISLKSYRVIYDLIDDVERMIRGQIEPEFEEQVIGHAEVRQVIHVPRSGNIAGSYVTDGVVRRGAKARLTRNNKEVYKGSIAQLRRFKEDVREVTTGFECGINLQNYDNVQQGDITEVYELVEVPV